MIASNSLRNFIVHTNKRLFLSVNNFRLPLPQMTTTPLGAQEGNKALNSITKSSKDFLNNNNNNNDNNNTNFIKEMYSTSNQQPPQPPQPPQSSTTTTTTFTINQKAPGTPTLKDCTAPNDVPPGFIVGDGKTQTQHVIHMKGPSTPSNTPPNTPNKGVNVQVNMASTPPSSSSPPPPPPPPPLSKPTGFKLNTPANPNDIINQTINDKSFTSSGCCPNVNATAAATPKGNITFTTGAKDSPKHLTTLEGFYEFFEHPLTWDRNNGFINLMLAIIIFSYCFLTTSNPNGSYDGDKKK